MTIIAISNDLTQNFNDCNNGIKHNIELLLIPLRFRYTDILFAQLFVQ